MICLQSWTLKADETQLQNHTCRSIYHIRPLCMRRGIMHGDQLMWPNAGVHHNAEPMLQPMKFNQRLKIPCRDALGVN